MKVGLDESNVSFSHAWARNVYGELYLPDLTDYTKLSIDSAVLGSGTCHILELKRNNTTLKNISISSSVQEFDISEYSGSGYYIAVGAYDLRIAASYIELNNIRLIK